MGFMDPPPLKPKPVRPTATHAMLASPRMYILRVSALAGMAAFSLVGGVAVVFLWPTLVSTGSARAWSALIIVACAAAGTLFGVWSGRLVLKDLLSRPSSPPEA